MTNAKSSKLKDRQKPSSVSKLKRCSLGASWLGRPVCKSKPGGSGRQHIEHGAAKPLAVRKGHHSLGCTNHSTGSRLREVITSHCSALVKSRPWTRFRLPNAEEILTNWRESKRGRPWFIGPGVLDMQGKAEESGFDQPES